MEPDRGMLSTASGVPRGTGTVGLFTTLGLTSWVGPTGTVPWASDIRSASYALCCARS